ncbi:MAG TPA: hypothetical protein VIQ27_13055 [Gemmatimonadales bacterium]
MMSSLSRRVCTHALAVMALSLPAVVQAQQSDADLKAVSATTLSMPKYKQYLDATVNLANVAADNPGLAEGMKDSGEKSIADQVRALESNPQVKTAVTSTGLTTRDYVLTQWALLQTGMAYAMTKGTGASQEDMIKKGGVSKANMDFYAQNEAEINRLAEEAKARAPNVADEDDSGDEEEAAE